LYSGYQWFKDTTPITGADNQYYLTSKIPGTYTVEALDKNGCKTMSNEIIVGGGGTKSLLVYPNPAISSFKLTINDDPVGKIRIRIINSSGAEIMNFSSEKSDFEFSREISIGNLDKGFYFVQAVVNEVYLYSVKIMVIK
jgi:hypothetical protein